MWCVKAKRATENPVTDREAVSLDEGVAMLLQKFKLEPSIVAGSPYADLHANDVGLLVMLRQPEKWSVRRIALSLGAPITTISSALDRLESRGLVIRAPGTGSSPKFDRIKWRSAGPCWHYWTHTTAKALSAWYRGWHRPKVSQEGRDPRTWCLR
jgi:hypothetical protein